MINLFNDKKLVAEKIMQKYGHKEGAGLGKMNQGIAAPLEVEKTSRRGGKIVATKPATSSYGSGSPVTPSTPQPPPPNIRKLPNLSRPTKIVCLQNMVSANEVDSDLPDEVSSECSKFGQVVKGSHTYCDVCLCLIKYEYAKFQTSLPKNRFASFSSSAAWKRR